MKYSHNVDVEVIEVQGCMALSWLLGIQQIGDEGRATIDGKMFKTTSSKVNAWE